MTSGVAAYKNYGVQIDEKSSEFVTIYIGELMFGIPVLKVQDVIGVQQISIVPLSKREIAGLLNLRGRIVTAINTDQRIGFFNNTDLETKTNVVVEHNGDLYSLLVDGVGDVLDLPDAHFEQNPANLEAQLKDVSAGVYRLESKLMMILDIEKILNF